MSLEKVVIIQWKQLARNKPLILDNVLKVKKWKEMIFQQKMLEQLDTDIEKKKINLNIPNYVQKVTQIGSQSFLQKLKQ